MPGAASLVYVSGAEPGIRRVKRGRGFAYLNPDGSAVTDEAALARIRSLAIPPAYTDVWICRDPCGHMQATGRDQKGRKQYRYHKDWHGEQDASKFQRLVAFGRSLPALRTRIASDMQLRGLARHKVLATVVNLLDRTLIRVGNAEYAKGNDSYGLTTLQNRHVELKGASLHFRFKGKSGKVWQLRISDRRIARIVRQIQDLPGQDLFQYLDEEGQVRDVTSADVNAYIREIAGEQTSAKDFRTWTGTVLAARALSEAGPFTSKRDAASRSGARCTRWRSASATPSPSAAAAMFIPPLSMAIWRASPAPCRQMRASGRWPFSGGTGRAALPRKDLPLRAQAASSRTLAISARAAFGQGS